MAHTRRDVDVLVIGAGMAGLSAAADVARAGRRVLVLDKGRGVGGRLASRRIGDATFDHGAQFITAHTPRFAAVIEECRRAGVVEHWCNGFSEGAEGHARWRGAPAMTSLAKHLAQGLDIVLERQVVSLRRVADRWHADTAPGEVFSGRSLVLTAPVPQSLPILAAGGIDLRPDARARLESVEYERCLAVMAVLAGPSRLAPPGGLAPSDGPIAWIADNRLKGISAEPAVTVHATHAFSLAHWDADREEVGRRLLAAAEPWLGASVKKVQVHGWRYSRPTRFEGHPCAIVSQAPLLVLAGDGFGGSRVEGAALSGWAAAEAVLA